MSHFTPRRSFVVVFLLVFLYLGVSSALDSQVRTHFYPNYSVFYDSDSFENSTLAYALCEQQPTSEDQRCRIVLEKNDDDDSVVLACDLTLRTGQTIKDGLFGPKLDVAVMRNDRVVVIWWEKESSSSSEYLMRLSLVTFLTTDDDDDDDEDNVTNCRTIESKLNFTARYVRDVIKIVDHASHYDFVFKNANECADNFCKMTVDVDGNLMGQPAIWTELYRSEAKPLLASVAPDSSAMGYLLIEGIGKAELVTVQVKESWPVSLIVANGKKMHLKNMTHIFPSFYEPSYSTANDAIGLCSQSSIETVNCTRFDLEGKSKFDANLTLEPVMFLTAMHNTADGGFLLMLTDCHSNGCANSVQRHNVTRIGNDGRAIIGYLSFELLKCELIENLADARLFEDSPGRYCASFVCYKRDYLVLRDDIGHFDLTKVCFGDDDFGL